MIDDNNPDATGTTRRSGNTARSWPGADKRDMGDMLHVIAYEHLYDQKDEMKLYRKKSKNQKDDDRLTFDTNAVKLWVKEANLEVQRRANRRRLGLQTDDYLSTQGLWE